MSCVQCVICTELMSDECILSHLECGHVYHQPCLNRWIRSSTDSKTCPECRVAINSAPRRLYLHFTNQPDVAELRGEITQKNGLLEMTVATLEQQNAKKDRIIRLTLTQINRLVNSNIRFKRVVSELEQSSKLTTANTVQLTQQLRGQTEQRQVLSTVVESLREHEHSLNVKLRENKTTIAQMADTIRTLDKAQADRIIENYQLELNRNELSTQLDQFRTKFVEANIELQQMKSKNENLRNELKVQRTGKQELVEVNFQLREKLQKTEATLLAMTNANMTVKMLNDATEAKILIPQNGNSSIKPIITNTCNGKGEGKTKLHLMQETKLKHKFGEIITIPSSDKGASWAKSHLTHETRPRRKTGEIIGKQANNVKRPKLNDSHSNANHVNKIVMAKSPIGWSIVPKHE